MLPFSGSFNLSEIQCVYNTGLSASITPLKDGFVIGYSCGYNGNAEYYKGSASLSNVSNIVTVLNPSNITGHSTPVFLLKGECTAGKTVAMSVNSNGGAWSGGSVLLIAIPK